MIKELLIKIILVLLMFLVPTTFIILAGLISIWFMFGIVSFIPLYFISVDYCENHEKTSFLHVDIDL